MVTTKSLLCWALAISQSLAAPGLRLESSRKDLKGRNSDVISPGVYVQPLSIVTHLESPTHPTQKRASQPDELAAAAEKVGFERFEWVVDHLGPGEKLARSSAPHYHGKDSDQTLTKESVAFLKSQGITHVIGVNSDAENEEIRSRLRQGGIDYTALVVADLTSPTVGQLRQAYDAFRRHKTGTLVWCGYGHGRTGTAVSAIQILSETGRGSGYKFTDEDFNKNHVETETQLKTLRALQNLALGDKIDGKSTL
ncbi:hypothetical protein HIM_03753 [Hirsutella minnesotensis 3608]|uniref:Swiss Army Knife protein DSP-PTPase phosphatase domain-containing protein n=1 Tax=Hirsutella minnesotensis 3608 TaxID=1043627 RepID=A0A0F7ZM16_9HYPO|nr:hypothetical protein HIM_03753 [Hirsutella minnesotensis 3608]